MEAYFFIIPATGMVFVLLGIYKLKEQGKENRFFRLMKGTPLSKISGIRDGQVKIFGDVKGKEELKSAYSSRSCVYFKSVTEQYRRRGKRGAAWVTISTERESSPFWVADGTGKIPIDLENSQNSFIVVEEKTIEGGKPKAASIGPFRYEGFSIGDTRKMEYLLKAGDKVLVYGKLDQGKISCSEKYPVLISTMPEEQVIAKYGSDNWRSYLGGIASIAVGTLLIVTGYMVIFGPFRLIH